MWLIKRHSASLHNTNRNRTGKSEPRKMVTLTRGGVVVLIFVSHSTLLGLLLTIRFVTLFHIPETYTFKNLVTAFNACFIKATLLELRVYFIWMINLLVIFVYTIFSNRILIGHTLHIAYYLPFISDVLLCLNVHIYKRFCNSWTGLFIQQLP